jgi:heat shock protein HslJ
MAAACLAACGSWSEAADSSPEATIASPSNTGRHVDIYTATEWRQDGSPVAFMPNTVVQLAVADNGRLSVQTGCGLVAGDYDLSAGTLRLANVSWSHSLEETAFCVADGMRQDAQIATFIQSNPTYTETGETVTLASPTMTLSFVAQH